MHLVSCEHPKYVYNKYTREFVRIRCGVCDSCLIAKSYDWVSRLDLESQVHKYCFMVTLTYDDDHLPAVFYSEDMQSLVYNREDSECIPLHELEQFLLDKSKDIEDYEKQITYVTSRLVHPLGLPVVYKKDISNFFKRLNKITYEQVTQTFENYRYFCCHEYGPTTYRPHSHMLVWFDNDSISQRFSELLLQAWPFGRTDASAVFSNGGKSYVAQYVNMFTHLPAVYSFRRFRPSHQESKFPSVGSYVLLDSEIRETYDRLLTKRNVWSSTSGRYVFVPVSIAVKNRFFPKLQGYNNLSDSDRVGLYRAYEQFYPYSSEFTGFYDKISAFVGLQTEFSSTSYYGIIQNYINRLLSNVEGDMDSFKNSVRRWYYLSKRICLHAHLCGYTVRFLVSQIVEFHQKLDYENLIMFYQFQEDYAKLHSVTDLILGYPEFYRVLKNSFTDGTELPFYLSVAAAQFDVYSLEDLPSYKDCFDFNAMKQQNFDIYKDTHKRHAVNAYRDGYLSVTDSQLSTILKSYQNT